MRRTTAALTVAICALIWTAAGGARVLRVGSYHGVKGQFTTIQAAVNASRPGDWILIGPGDYKTTSSRMPRGRSTLPAGVLISTPNIRLRGMNRNTVIVDGTRPGSPRCSSSQSAQNLGPASHGSRLGLNGILVWKADNVWVQNLTACNFLSGSGDAGNEIWFNGGAGSGKIGGWGYNGSYLTTTNTFYMPNHTAAQYGIFSSNWSGGTWSQTYASNFSDSGYYIGGCQQQCDQTITHAHAQFNALGYSGTNSGGRLVVENSEFDHNQDGFDTDSENGDAPSPQNGACPNNGISPITHTHSCWVLRNNYIHDNNNTNVPEVGQAGSTPVGVGVSLSGARNDTVMHNRIVRNDAWGVLIQVQQASGPPCISGVLNFSFLGINLPCLFDPYGDAILHNSFANNGSFGHQTNGDIAAFNLLSGHPVSCYRGNTNPAELSTSPAGLEQTYPACTGAPGPAIQNVPLIVEILCGNEGALVGQQPQCPGGVPYPKRTEVVMHPLPSNLQTMSDPCAGVPADPWCPSRKPPSTPTSGLG